MARPPISGGFEAAGNDLAALTRILRRISADHSRPEAKRQAMGQHLLAVIQELQAELLAPHGQKENG